MKQTIDIFDNFLNESELEQFLNAILSVNWKYSGRSSDNTPRFWNADLSRELFLTTNIFSKIQEKTKRRFKLERVYANGQTYGQDGSFHIDDTRDNTYTFILYASSILPSNVDIVGGFTQFKMDKTILNVEPYINRGVFFDSRIYHRGLAPTRYTDTLRISVAFKLVEII